ncbi:ABC-type phosphate/phosphonate transport system substrate-binding protein [Bradyrhizobium sp. AZCC 1577]
MHLGQHDAVARAVAAGQVPAGALSEQIYRVLVETKKIDPTRIRQLALSEPIPNYPLTVQGFLKPELKEAIKRAFLDLKDPAILKLFRVEGIATATDKDYDVLRDMAKVLQLDVAKL